MLVDASCLLYSTQCAGAYIMMNQLPHIPLHGKAYSDSGDALDLMATIADALGMRLLRCRGLHQVADIEKQQLRAFADWRLPLIISILMALPITTYCVLRYIVWGPQNPWDTIFMYVGNKIAAWLALWLYAACYLPGAAVQLGSLIAGKRALDLPRKSCTMFTWYSRC
jgi:hypothetical protein